jgi:hypothetical protein
MNLATTNAIGIIIPWVLFTLHIIWFCWCEKQYDLLNHCKHPKFFDVVGGVVWVAVTICVAAVLLAR